MKKIEINCDMCEADLRYTGYMAEYYFTLSPTAKTNPGNSAFATALEPHIKRDHHFCGMQCLSDWTSKWADQMRAFKESRDTARQQHFEKKDAPS